MVISLAYDEVSRCLMATLDGHLSVSPYPFKWRKVNGKWQLFLPRTKMNQEGLDEAFEMILDNGIWMEVCVPSFKKLLKPETRWLRCDKEWSDEKYDCYEVFYEYLYEEE